MKDAKTPQEKAMAERMSRKNCYMASDEVVEYLGGNAEDFKGEKVWEVGSKNHQDRNDSRDICIWFKRKSDAMEFMKKFSVYNNPTTIFNYFNGKHLN